MNNEISNIVAMPLTPFAKDLKHAQKTIVSDGESIGLAKKSKEDIDGSSKAKVMSLDDARRLVEEGNKLLDNVQRNLQFKVDESTKQVVMSIVDKSTGEVIKQIPSEDVLALAKRMQEAGGELGGIVQDRA